MSHEERLLLEKIQSPAKLAEFASNGTWRPYRHLTYISNRLVRAVTDPEQTFDSIQVSVRHGKSELISKWFVVWFLGLFPDRHVLIVSYNEDFAKKWGRATRDLYSEWGPELFGHSVREDASSTTEWLTTGGGGLRAAGGIGSITGLGFDLIVIDDPIKNIEDALSPATNEKMRNWYDTTLRTRLTPKLVDERSGQLVTPGGSMILTMARWTDYDLAAYVTGEMETDDEVNPFRDEWNVVRLPAIAEAPAGEDPETWRDELGRAEGEALWPQVWPVSALRPMMGTSAWDSLYQQNPVPKTGGMFPKENWVIRTAPAESAGWRRCRFWDTAASKGKGDWTVGALLGIDGQNNIWVLDIVREQVDASGVEHLMKKTAERDGTGVAIRYEQAKAAAGKATTRAYARLLVGYDFAGVPVEGDKIQRASLFSSAQQNKLVTLAEAPWNAELVQEHSRFPKGRHDDQCLIGSTTVITPHGPERLDALRSGDVILGASGWVDVEWAGQTGESVTVRHLGLEGTPGHPVWTDGGWVPLAEVSAGCNVVAWDAPWTGVSEKSRPGVGASCTTSGGERAATLATPEREVSASLMPAAPSAGRGGSLSVASARSTTAVGGGRGAPSAQPRPLAPSGWRSSPTEESLSGATRTHPTRPTATTTSQVAPTSPEGLSLSTGKSGRMPTARSQRDATSTTSTATSTTTIPTTLASSRAVTTSDSTTRKVPRLRTPSVLTSNASDLWLPLGIARQRAVSGTASTPSDKVSAVHNVRTSDGTFFADGVLVHNCDACSGAFQFLTAAGPSDIYTPTDVLGKSPVDRIKAEIRDRLPSA